VDVLARALSSMGPIGVGLIFLVTAGAKAVAPSRTRRHLQLLGLVPYRWIEPAATLLPIGEAALGAALVAGLAPTRVLPSAVGLLAGLAGLTIWSTSTRRTEDCGCYGGLVEVQPTVSVLLNAVYAALLGIACRTSRPPAGPWSRGVAWRAVVVLATAVLTTGVTTFAARRLRATGRDLVDLRPLRPGRRWDRRWLGAHPDELAAGEKVVAFLGQSCPLCKLWLRPLKVIHARGDLPPVVAAMGASEEEVTDFAAQHALTFPIVPVAPASVARLVDGVPTIAVVEDGVIRSVDTGRLPPVLLERVKRPARSTPALPGWDVAARLARALALSGDERARFEAAAGGDRPRSAAFGDSPRIPKAPVPAARELRAAR
jgi:hypothetical protein